MPHVVPHHRGWRSNKQDQTHGSERYERPFEPADNQPDEAPDEPEADQ